MPENTLKTRILLKYDTYQNWIDSDLVLKKGEVGIAEIPGETEGTKLTPPAIGIKVGDGENTFTNLNWIQAIAGDVSAWAKAAQKPTYKATEIQELDTYIDSRVAVDETLYKIVTEDEGATYKLQKKGPSDEVYTDVEESTAIDLTTLNTRITALETNKQDKLVFESPYNAETNKVATKADIDTALQGLAGALKYKGSLDDLPEDTTGYTDGDVIAVGNKEYVCESGAWRELGDESSFAVKGSIKDADIAADANIAQSKINGLEDALASKIEKITVNGTDVTVNEEKTAEIKLADIAIDGEVKNLKQTDDTILVLNCGSATEVI